MLETINRRNIEKHLIEYELEIVGHKLVDTFYDDRWYFHWTITLNQFQQFHSYAIPLLKKTFRCRREIAEDCFKWFYKQHGLRIKG